jgi:hypothetical protein
VYGWLRSNVLELVNTIGKEMHIVFFGKERAEIKPGLLLDIMTIGSKATIAAELIGVLGIFLGSSV